MLKWKENSARKAHLALVVRVFSQAPADLRCLFLLNYHAIPPTGLVIDVWRGMGGHFQAVFADLAVVSVVAVRGGR